MHASRTLRRFISILLLSGFLTACQTTREITIDSRPGGALIKVDGHDVGSAPVVQKLIFKNQADIHRVVASKRGFRDGLVEVTQAFDQKTLTIDLKPQSRHFTFTVTPEPAVLSIDGQLVTAGPVTFYAADLPFTINEKGEWTTHQVSAQRAGYQTLTRTLIFEEPDSNIQLALDAMRKDLSITTTPAGATVVLDGRTLGVSPVSAPGEAFPVDPETGKFIPKTLVVSKPGYDPVKATVGWDDGKTDYHVELLAKRKMVIITTSPAGASVVIEGRTLEQDASGRSTAKLEFPPTNDKGDLKQFTATVSKKTADSEWTPAELAIGWDNGKTDYEISLKEIITRPVSLVSAEPVRGDDGWSIQPRRTTTIAMKDVTEGPQKPSPVQLTQFGPGTMIDSIAVSPDGKRILFVQLLNDDPRNFRSQLVSIASDGTSGTTLLTDGKSLDLTPSYTPDGANVIFSSNRAGKRPSVWQMDANGASGVTQLTSGDTTDLWPSIDSDPKPRLFYEALVDTRPDPRLYMTQLGTTIRTDLIQSGGRQPRISPKGDAIVFVGVNNKTGKRDLYRMTDKGGTPENLTNTPDADEFDPVWNQDGTKIAFVSDRGVNEEGMNNNDIWVIDLSKPERPIQITSNGSWDDSPGWDPTGSFIYFRSNRGGSWQIWRVAAK